MTMHYVVADCEAVTEAYLNSGYKRSSRTVLEQLGANLYKLLSKETRAGLTVLEIDAEQHEKLNSNERASRPVYKHTPMITAARVERVEVLERGGWHSMVAPVLDDLTDSHPLECETSDLHLTSERCAQSMERTVREAIDQHLDAIGELRKFLETKH
jgi:hypothetical protein